MAMLGDILAEARVSSARFARYLAQADPEAAAHLAAAADATGESAAGFVRRAVAEFACEASEEDWATLVSRLRGAEDPGQACLFAMIEWRLATPAAPSRETTR